MQLDQLCILHLHRSNSSESGAERTLADWSHSCLRSGLEVTTSHLACVCSTQQSAMVVYVCGECVRAWVTMSALWLLEDQESHAVLNIQRPCCFLSNTAQAAWVRGRSLWVYLERVPSEENSAPSPLICMDLYGMRLHLSRISGVPTKQTWQRPNSSLHNIEQEQIESLSNNGDTWWVV